MIIRIGYQINLVVPRDTKGWDAFQFSCLFWHFLSRLADFKVTSVLTVLRYQTRPQVGCMYQYMCSECVQSKILFILVTFIFIPFFRT